MSPALCWTLERCELVGKLVRRYAFDFDAASYALRAHLKSEGVDFSSEATSPTSVRKVFASLDRKSTNKPISFGSGQNEEETTTGTLRAQNSIVGKKREDTNPAPAKHDTQRGEARHTSDLPNHLDEAQTGTNAPSSSPPSSSTNEPAWDFESFLEEQRCRELQHDDRKEKAFQKVLSALGGNGDLSGAPELPPEIVQAWGARNEKLSVEAGNAQKRQQKLEEDRVLALQRQSLRQRHLPGSDDRVGEDPLGSLVGGTTSTSRGQGREESGELANDEPSREQQDVVSFANEAPAGPVRLELGMDAEVLDKILDEIEASAPATDGCRETNSELSRVLDELDLAAAGDSAATTAPLLAGVRE